MTERLTGKLDSRFWREDFADSRELSPGQPRLSLAAGKTMEGRLLSLVY